MSLDLHLSDDLSPLWQLAHDVYTPQLSRFEPAISHGDDYIEHIDVVTTWKGLNFQHAEELLFLEKAFQNALHSIVEEYLLERIKKKSVGLTFDESKA